MEPSRLVNSYLVSLIELKQARENAFEESLKNFRGSWNSSGQLSRSLQTLLPKFRLTQRNEPIRVVFTWVVVEAYGQHIWLPRFRKLIIGFNGSKSYSKKYSAIDIKYLKLDFENSIFKFQKGGGILLWSEILEFAEQLEIIVRSWSAFKKVWQKNYLNISNFVHEDQLNNSLSTINSLFAEIVRLEESIDDALFEFNFKMPSRFHSIKVRWDEKVPAQQKRFGCRDVKFLIYLYFPRYSAKRTGLDITSFKQKHLEKVKGSNVTPWITEELISKSKLGRKRSYILSFQSRLRKLLSERELHLLTLVSFIENFSE